jgi:hypothetical protein
VEKPLSERFGWWALLCGKLRAAVAVVRSGERESRKEEEAERRTHSRKSSDRVAH